jgi:magnesium transporter
VDQQRRTSRRRRRRVPAIRPDAKIATSPGTFTAPADGHPTSLSVIAYGPDRLEELESVEIGQLHDLASEYPVVWLNMVGLGSAELLQELGETLGLHRLALEDVMNVPQRTKHDDYGDHQFMVARLPIETTHLVTEQLSVFAREQFIVTIQEKPGDCFDPVRRRIREGRVRIRNSGPDYLLYAILDALIDSYFPLLESIAATLDEMEGWVYENPQKDHAEQLHGLKRDLVTCRRYIWPLKELTAGLLRPDASYLADETRDYVRDCHDHVSQALDLVDSYSDVASGLMDFYLSMMSQRMNEVMQVLTVIATIFIPLSFITGLYGMNFDPTVSPWNMPELGWRYGYPMALGLIVACVLGMLVYFRRRGWFR